MSTSGAPAHARAGIAARPLTVRRSTLVFVPGVAVGVLWLAPVFAQPGTPSLLASGFPGARYARILSVLFLFPLVAGRLGSVLRRERLIRVVLVAFVLLPLVTLVNHPDAAFATGTVGPYAVGGASLACLAALRDQEFAHWLRGVGFAALLFVTAGLLRYGLATTVYYGRPRAHLGFDHPTQSASAVYAAAVYLALVLAWRLRRTPVARALTLTAVVTAGGWVLLLVSSRNTFVLLFVSLAMAGFARAARGAVPRMLALGGIVALFPAIMAFAVRGGGERSPLWQAANVLSSLRLSIYRDLLERLAYEDAFSLLFGPTYVVRELKGGLSGFAVSDSTYLTIVLNYGLLTIAAFYAFWLLVGTRLSRRGTPMQFGMFCGLSLYLLLDAQGVTPSNMLIFSLVAWCVRSARRGDQFLGAVRPAAAPPPVPGPCASA